MHHKYKGEVNYTSDLILHHGAMVKYYFGPLDLALKHRPHYICFFLQDKEWQIDSF